MKFAFKLKLSTYRIMVKRGITCDRMRKKDFYKADFSGLDMRGDFADASFADASFAGASFAGASFARASFADASFAYASFAYASFADASLNIYGIGVQFTIGKYKASLFGKYISVGCVTRRIKDAMKGTEQDYAKAHREAAAYRITVQRTIKAVFAMRRAARLTKAA